MNKWYKLNWFLKNLSSWRMANIQRNLLYSKQFTTYSIWLYIYTADLCCLRTPCNLSALTKPGVLISIKRSLLLPLSDWFTWVFLVVIKLNLMIKTTPIKLSEVFSHGNLNKRSYSFIYQNIWGHAIHQALVRCYLGNYSPPHPTNCNYL